MIFGLFKERKARSAVQQTIMKLGTEIELLSPVDRAAVLAISNSLLEKSSETYGEMVTKNLLKIPASTAIDIITALSESHVKVLNEGLAPIQDRGMHDVGYAQAMRQLRAYEIVIVSVGQVLFPEIKKDVREAWRILWKARENAHESADTLMRYAKIAGVDPLPRTRKRTGPVTHQDCLILASRCPDFLKSKPVAKKK